MRTAFCGVTETALPVADVRGGLGLEGWCGGEVRRGVDGRVTGAMNERVYALEKPSTFV